MWFLIIFLLECKFHEGRDFYLFRLLLCCQHPKQYLTCSDNYVLDNCLVSEGMEQMIRWIFLGVFLQNVTTYTGIHTSHEPALSLVQDCMFLGQLSSPWDCFSQVRWADPAYSTGLVQEIKRNVQIAFKWKGLVGNSRHSYYQTIGEFDLKVVWEYSWNPQEQIVSAFAEIRRENETSQRNSFSYSSPSCWIVLRLDLVQAG